MDRFLLRVRDGLLRLPIAFRISIIATTLLLLPTIIYYRRNIAHLPTMHKQNRLMLLLPCILHRVIRSWWAPVECGDLGPPRKVSALTSAEWPGSWAVPQVPRSTLYSKSTGISPVYSGPAWVALYIFSTPSTWSRHRRALIRQYHPTQLIPVHLRPLIELKFIVGFPPRTDDEAKQEVDRMEEEKIRKEQETYGDIVRLEGLVNGENMNDGKSWEWAVWAGTEGREAQWVFKCDDDTCILLPNLLDLLRTLDSSKPTYIGSSLGHWPGYLWYFTGMMYGFSWGIIKTIATSGVQREMFTSSWHEDAFMGEMMYCLPSKPTSTSSIEHYNLSSPGSGLVWPFLSPITSITGSIKRIVDQNLPVWNSPPQSPDPLSGLVRVDLGGRMGELGDWWIADVRSAICWHPLKIDDDFVNAYRQAHQHFGTDKT